MSQFKYVTVTNSYDEMELFSLKSLILGKKKESNNQNQFFHLLNFKDGDYIFYWKNIAFYFLIT